MVKLQIRVPAFVVYRFGRYNQLAKRFTRVCTDSSVERGIWTEHLLWFEAITSWPHPLERMSLCTSSFYLTQSQEYKPHKSDNQSAVPPSESIL
jgi:hypothetical protein